MLLTRQRQPQLHKKVFVGLSGGVDSAVSAALLKDQGYEVTGVFIKIQISGYPCPAARDRIEAMRVAAHLKIPFLEIDLSKEYEREVFRPSIDEFTKGRTPNPDTLCNEKIKFGIFFDFCRKNGADFVATGHYAQIKNWTSDVQLHTSVDANKDQSYFLWAVPEEALKHTLFPVGHLTKPEVRTLATKFGLPNAARYDSQGLCFLGDIGLDDMLAREVPHTSGNVLSESGEIVGTHEGVELYTLGQRHGFMLSQHSTHTEPQYVIAKDLHKNTITVSTSRFPRNAHATEVLLTHTNWISRVEDGLYRARYRYRQTLIPAELRKSDFRESDGSPTSVLLLEPHYVPLGQSLVLYRGDRCLGGGVIQDATILK
jgi:tRNA-specific 2-thiouridylase